MQTGTARQLLPILLVLTAAGCATAPPTAFDPGKHEAKQWRFWRERTDFTRPVEDRVGAIPDELLDYIRQDNRHQGFEEVPESLELTPEFARDFREAILAMPDVIRARLKPVLTGIFIVRNLGGTAFSDVIWDAKDPRAAFMLLDAAVLERTANAWATWKERSPYVEDPRFSLDAVIEQGAEDNRRQAIQFILLHEFGHVIAVREKFHPPWAFPADEVNAKEGTFSRLSWTVREKLWSSIRSPELKTAYYQPAARRIPAARMTELYKALPKSDFVTLYSATNPFDDFADSFAHYVHTVLMKRPWHVIVHANGKLALDYSPSWNEPRLKAKRAILEGLLTTPK